MPQLYLKSGEWMQVFHQPDAVYNPTAYHAKPLLRIYGTGKITVGNGEMTITENDSYIDIDCEMQDAYRGTQNLNGDISLASGDFPVLKAGKNNVTLGSGITKVIITPRWWLI